MKTLKTHYRSLLPILLAVPALLLAGACSGGNGSGSSSGSASVNEAGFTEFEMEHGIGPVTERIELDEIDPALVEKGRSVYRMKCEACHNMEGRMVGPALGDVMERRSAEFVMNFILNPSEMAREHPEGIKMLQEYMTPMPFQNVSLDEARAIVDYLRDYSSL